MRARRRALWERALRRGVYVALRSLGRISYVPKSYLVHFFWPPGDRSWFWPGGHLPEGVVVGFPLPLPSSSAANDGAAVTDSATTNMAASVSIKIMRFMRYFLSLSHPPNGVPLKRCQVGCEFAGAGRVVCASTLSYKQASCPLPLIFLHS